MDAERKALIVMDMINDYVLSGSPLQIAKARDIVKHILGEIRYARNKKRPIFYVSDSHEKDDPEFEHWPPHAIKQSPGACIIKELTPLSGDYIIGKSGYSGFFRTDLERLLDEMAIHEILICGVMTNVSVLYTAVDAMQRGLQVIVPETCVAALDDASHDFALRQIQDLPSLFARK